MVEEVADFLGDLPNVIQVEGLLELLLLLHEDGRQNLTHVKPRYLVVVAFIDKMHEVHQLLRVAVRS